MTQFEQTIYNLYLKTSRSRQNKPFRLRKQFDNFENNPNYGYVKKLSAFFGKYKHVGLEDFFDAPYHVYTDTGSYDLKFYTTQKAIKAFSLYRQKIENSAPDSNTQINFTKKSLAFIYKFCKDNELKLNEYLQHKDGNVNAFFIHLKEGKVNLYTLLYFENLHNMIQKMDQDIIEFMFPNFYRKVSESRTKYNNTPKIKSLINEGFDIIKKGLE